MINSPPMGHADGGSRDMEDSGFERDRPRTAKAEVLKREKIAQTKMKQLLSIRDEETFKRILIETFGLKPGSPQFEKALSVWREGSS
jgi:hypothetical protein